MKKDYGRIVIDRMERRISKCDAILVGLLLGVVLGACIAAIVFAY